MNDITRTRTHEARAITTALGAVCALGCTAALVPAVEHTANRGALALVALALLAGAARLTVRWARERREDRADMVTAARWRVQHAPHLLTDQDRARLHVAATRSVVEAVA